MPSHISILNDCLDSDARLRIESQIKRLFPSVPFTFYGVPIFSTLSVSFLLHEGDFGEGDLVLFNAAPRKEESVFVDNRSGELVFLKLKSGAWAVGPNEGLSLALQSDQVEAIYTDPQDRANKEGTQFRSAYLFPKLAEEFLSAQQKGFEKQDVNAWVFPKIKTTKIAWIDSFGNLKLSSTETLELGKTYRVTISRDGKELLSTDVPYRERLTNVGSGELALTKGSSFGGQGLELIYREALPGQQTTTRFLKKQFDVEVLPEDDILLV